MLQVQIECDAFFECRYILESRIHGGKVICIWRPTVRFEMWMFDILDLSVSKPVLRLKQLNFIGRRALLIFFGLNSVSPNLPLDKLKETSPAKLFNMRRALEVRRPELGYMEFPAPNEHNPEHLMFIH